MVINSISIETGLWHIQRHLMNKYGTAQASRDISPLNWYINTGRATTDFLRKLFTAKPFMIARKLHAGGSDEEVISRICDYIGYSRY